MRACDSHTHTTSCRATCFAPRCVMLVPRPLLPFCMCFVLSMRLGIKLMSAVPRVHTRPHAHITDMGTRTASHAATSQPHPAHTHTHTARCRGARLRACHLPTFTTACKAVCPFSARGLCMCCPIMSLSHANCVMQGDAPRSSFSPCASMLYALCECALASF